MILKKKFLIPLLALVFILAGTASSIYIYNQQSNIEIDSESIIIYNEKVTIDWIFSNVLTKKFEDINSSGVALDDLIMKVGIDCPSCYNYKISAADGYSKTVLWENLKNGILEKGKRVVFSDLPKAYHVRDIAEIEVIIIG
jgi:hypothetical protein